MIYGVKDMHASWTSTRPRPPRWHDFCVADHVYLDDDVRNATAALTTTVDQSEDRQALVSTLRRTRSKLDIDPQQKYAEKWRTLYNEPDIDYNRPETRCFEATTCTGYCRLKHPSSILCNGLRSKSTSNLFQGHRYTLPGDPDDPCAMETSTNANNHVRCSRWIDEVHRARSVDSSSSSRDLLSVIGHGRHPPRPRRIIATLRKHRGC